MRINAPTVLLVVSIIVFLAIGAWWLLKEGRVIPNPASTDNSLYVTSTLPVPNATASVETPVQTATLGAKLYRNEEWKFEFWYPGNFFIRERDFVSRYSQFNLYIMDERQGGLERAFLVNVVLPEFADRSFSGLEKTVRNVVVAGISGVEYEYEFNERYETMTILPFGDLRLILGIHYEEYKDLYKEVLNTFRLLK